MFKRAVTFGRFNVPHLGHLSLFNTMAVLGLEVKVLVSKGKGNLPLEARLSLLRKLCPNPRVQFIPAASVFTQGHIDQETVVVLGQDQEGLGKALKSFFGCETFLLLRKESDPSSTRCRELIAQRNWGELVELIPPTLVEDTLCLIGKHDS